MRPARCLRLIAAVTCAVAVAGTAGACDDNEAEVGSRGAVRLGAVPDGWSRSESEAAAKIEAEPSTTLLFGRRNGDAYDGVIRITAHGTKRPLGGRVGSRPVTIAGKPGYEVFWRPPFATPPLELVWNLGDVGLRAAGPLRPDGLLLSVAEAVKATSVDDVAVDPLPDGYELVATLPRKAAVKAPDSAGAVKDTEDAAKVGGAFATLDRSGVDPLLLLHDAALRIEEAEVHGVDGWRGTGELPVVRSAAWEDEDTGFAVAFTCTNCTEDEFETFLDGVRLD